MSKKISIVLSLFFSVIAGLWIWTLCQPKNTIQIGGSASADPLMQKLTNKYQDNKFIYSSTGSGAGESNVKNGVYKIGFISKEPSSDFNNDMTSDFFNSDFSDFKNKINENNIKYAYTNIAIEKMAFAYNDSSAGEGFKAFEKYMDIKTGTSEFQTQDQTILQYIFGVEKSKNNNTQRTWLDLAKWIKEHNDNAKELSLDNISNKKINLYIPNPGSGTESTLLNILGIKTGDGQTITSAANVYNNNGSTNYQIESSPSSLGMLSFKFLKNENSGIKYFNINGKQPNDNSNSVQKYPSSLTRNFNAVFSKSISEKEFNFLKWILTNDTATEAYENEQLDRPSNN